MKAPDPLPQENRPTVTLEQLLRLKRAERPPPEFWERFDAELRQKQLAALMNGGVAELPLYKRLGRMLRWQIPACAGALLVFTLISLRTHAPVPFAATSVVSPPQTVALVVQSQQHTQQNVLVGDAPAAVAAVEVVAVATEPAGEAMKGTPVGSEVSYSIAPVVAMVVPVEASDAMPELDVGDGQDVNVTTRVVASPKDERRRQVLETLVASADTVDGERLALSSGRFDRHPLESRSDPSRMRMVGMTASTVSIRF